jgi:hypothetical protein
MIVKSECDWAPMDIAPKDGSMITVRVPECEARVFWCDELKRWVLISPRHAEYVNNPGGWRK